MRVEDEVGWIVNFRRNSSRTQMRSQRIAICHSDRELIVHMARVCGLDGNTDMVR